MQGKGKRKGHKEGSGSDNFGPLCFFLFMELIKGRTDCAQVYLREMRGKKSCFPRHFPLFTWSKGKSQTLLITKCAMSLWCG